MHRFTRIENALYYNLVHAECEEVETDGNGRVHGQDIQGDLSKMASQLHQRVYNVIIRTLKRITITTCPFHNLIG